MPGRYIGVAEDEVARDLAIDPDTGDLLLGRDAHLVTGVEAIAQAIRILFRTALGEWFLDDTVGLPLYESILVKSPNLVGIKEIYRRALLSVAGVLSVRSLDLELDIADRSLEITFTVDTDFGEWSDSYTVAAGNVAGGA